ncbi:hypothetical protein JCM8097_001465 [Rhodosporidiobolus ruineniae]
MAANPTDTAFPPSAHTHTPGGLNEKAPPPQYHGDALHSQQQQQLQTQPQMAVGGGGMGRTAAPPDLVGQGAEGREWSTGLCACKDDCGGFCLSCWCPCVTFGEYKQRLESLQNSGRALHRHETESFGSQSVMWLAVNCIVGAGWVFDMMARDDLRKRYNIHENACSGCLKTCCCLPCAQRQHHRELLREEERQWGAQGGDGAGGPGGVV